MVITFDHAESLSGNIISFYFQPSQRLRYSPGQFVELALPHAPVDNRGDRRIFTLINTPDESLFGIAATFPQPSSSFKKALRALRPGETAHLIGEPMGDFVLPKDPDIPLAWLAGGVASASFMAMAKQLAHEPLPRSIKFFQSARQAEDLVFGKVWEHAKLAPQQAVTGAAQGWTGRTARFTAADMLQAAADKSKTLFYISGSDAMVEQLCANLLAAGIKHEQLVREAYSGY